MKKYFVSCIIQICENCWKYDLMACFNQSWKCFAECDRCWYTIEVTPTEEEEKMIDEYLKKNTYLKSAVSSS